MMTSSTQARRRWLWGVVALGLVLTVGGILWFRSQPGNAAIAFMDAYNRGEYRALYATLTQESQALFPAPGAVGPSHVVFRMWPHLQECRVTDEERRANGEVVVTLASPSGSLRLRTKHEGGRWKVHLPGDDMERVLAAFARQHPESAAAAYSEFAVRPTTAK